MLIQGKLLNPMDDIQEAKLIRQEVFVKELNIPLEQEEDDRDTEAMHVIVYEEGDNKIPVATGRIVYDGENCQIDKIAVLKDYRGRGYGDFTVRMLLSKAFTAGISEVILTSPIMIKGFFEQIGFQQAGEEKIEKGIPSIQMAINSNNIATLCNKLKK